MTRDQFVQLINDEVNVYTIEGMTTVCAGNFSLMTLSGGSERQRVHDAKGYAASFKAEMIELFDEANK